MAEKPADSRAAIRLEPVGPAVRDAVLALELDAGQEDFVATTAESLDDAEDDEDARPRAILAGDEIVGFLMYDDAYDDDEALIYRFMIDRRRQGRGYGRAALAAALDEIGRIRRIRSVLVCYMPENAAARRLYLNAGFVEEGTDEDGEMLARLRLPKPAARR